MFVVYYDTRYRSHFRQYVCARVRFNDGCFALIGAVNQEKLNAIDPLTARSINNNGLTIFCNYERCGALLGRVEFTIYVSYMSSSLRDSLTFLANG